MRIWDEMKLLANRFFQLSFKKQLVILFMVYIASIITSIIVQFVHILVIIASF
jgi:hypothetical protein